MAFWDVECKIDPLSICTSAIAISQAVVVVTAGIREIAGLVDVPPEVSDLHNELETINGYLSKTKTLMESLESSSSPLHVDLSHIHSVIKSLERELRELAKMVNKTAQQMQAPSKRRRIVPGVNWRLNHRDVVRRRDRTRQLRTSLAAAIALLQPDQSLEQTALILEVKGVSELGFSQVKSLVEQATTDLQDAIGKMHEKITQLETKTKTPGDTMVLVLQEATQASDGVKDYLESMKPGNMPVQIRDYSLAMQKCINRLDTVQRKMSQKLEELQNSGAQHELIDAIRVLLEDHRLDASRLNDFNQLFPSAPSRRDAKLPMLQADSKVEQGGVDPEVIVQVQARLSRICPKMCRCDCHKVAKLRTPAFAAGIIGKFLISYNSFAVWNPRTCSHPTCLNHSDTAIRLNYIFPQWMLHRAVSFSVSWSNGISGHGASVFLRVPRVLPESHDVWRAIDNNNISRLQYLLDQKSVMPTDISERGENFLLAALRYYKCWPTARFLLDLPYNPTHLDDTGCSLVTMAKWRFVVYADEFHDESRHVFQQIIKANDKYSHTTILHDVLLGHQSIGLPVALGLDPSSINAIDDCGCTPLHWAVWKDDVEAVRLLLAWGADHSIKDLEERTALAIAASRGRVQCARLLIDANADVNVRDRWNWTPLFLAARELSVGLVRLLLQNGADPQAADDDKDTALSSPIHANEVKDCLVEIYAEFAKAGADMNVRNNDGRSPIMKTIPMNRPSMFKALWLNGADVDMVDARGQSVLHLAGMYARLEMIQQLKDTSVLVDPDLIDEQGHTARDYFQQRVTNPEFKLKGDQLKPSEKEILAFETLIDSGRTRYGMQEKECDESDEFEAKEILS